MNYTIALIMGIASSLIATALFIAITELFRRVILPWYGDLIYRGIRIDGKWECCRLGEDDVTSLKMKNEMVLKQKGDQISGTSLLQDGDESTPTIYNVRGQIRDGYFMALLWPQCTDMLDGATCLFRIFTSDGKFRMKGRHAYIDSKSAEVKGSPEEIEYSKGDS